MDDRHTAKLQSLLRNLSSDNTFEQLESISKQAPDSFSYPSSTFGWAPGLGNLQTAVSKLNLHPQDQQLPRSTDVPTCQQSSTTDHYDQISLPQLLASSSEASAPHSAAEIVDACGLSRFHESLRASAIVGLPDDQHVDSLRAAIKQRINEGWSQEAVRQGVGYAKAGNYAEAKRCYDKAIELQPDNVDAYVARGAALANEQNLPDAAADLEHALKLNPSNANASKYLAAVKSKAEQQGISLERPTTALHTNKPTDLAAGSHKEEALQAHETIADKCVRDSGYEEGETRLEDSLRSRGHKRHRSDEIDKHVTQHLADRQGDRRGDHVREQQPASDSSASSSQGTTSTSSGDDDVRAERRSDAGQSASTLKSALHEVLKARSKSSKRKHRSGDKKRKHGRHKHKDRKGKKRKRHK